MKKEIVFYSYQGDKEAEWGGELVEPKYTEGISSTDLISAVKAQGITPGKRMKTLRRVIGVKTIVRILEAHKVFTLNDCERQIGQY